MSKEKMEVYIGNGRTILVDNSGSTVNFIDIPKALEIFKNNPGKEISIGMRQDWYFTATTIKSEDEIKNLQLKCSDWDTPCICIDDSERIPCSIPIEKSLYGEVLKYGFDICVRKMEMWLGKDFVKDFRGLKYEKIKAMSKEVVAILEKYKNEP